METQTVVDPHELQPPGDRLVLPELFAPQRCQLLGVVIADLVAYPSQAKADELARRWERLRGKAIAGTTVESFLRARGVYQPDQRIGEIAALILRAMDERRAARARDVLLAQVEAALASTAADLPARS